MTRTVLIAALLLVLAACGKKDSGQGNQALSDDDFTRSAIVANDVTAIDAATGDSANMAADISPDALLGNGEGSGDETATTPSRSETRSRRAARTERADPSDDTPADSGPAETTTTNG